MPARLKQAMTYMLPAAVFLNLGSFLVLAPLTAVSESQMRWVGGVFLMLFVCTHGWYRYGLSRMIQFFFVTVIVTWLFESTSVAAGFPFGRFFYTEKLGEKIGSVPVMIFPAYFFNGYLAWTMAGIFFGRRGSGIDKKVLLKIPLVAALLMVAWNACFDPIMSTLQGYWIWQVDGLYYGVPLSNFAGWFLTTYLFFQLFALLLYFRETNLPVVSSHSYWAFIPIMYAIQGLPYILYPLFRSQDLSIYRAMALLTILVMLVPALFNLIALYRQCKPDGNSLRQTDENLDL